MSADAKVWQAENGDWCAVHDGDCLESEHRGSRYELIEIIAAVNTCRAPYPILHWNLHVYPDGHAGLRGFAW